MASTYIDFDKASKKGMDLIRTGENPTFGLLIICGINLGLRIGDLTSLTFDQLKKDEFTIIEEKTGKQRTLQINDSIKTALGYFSDDLSHELGGHAFTSQKGSVYRSQSVNRLIKQYFKGNDISSHSLRKSFGRRVWENNNKSESALVYLSKIFNHTSIAVTREYLGITQDEIKDIYLSL